VTPAKDYELKNLYIRDVWIRTRNCHLVRRSHTELHLNPMYITYNFRTFAMIYFIPGDARWIIFAG